MAILDTGEILVAGSNAQGQCDIPAAPPGLRYVGVVAGSAHTLLLLDDGQEAPGRS